MIVRLPARVMQLDHLASDVQAQPLSERYFGLGHVIGQEMPSAHRARQPLARGLWRPDPGRTRSPGAGLIHRLPGIICLI